MKVNTLSYKTMSTNSLTASKDWLMVDANGQHLGRFASKVARLLRGKHKPSFTYHVDGGDYVIVLNANKVVLTGNKWTDRVYLSYTGYPGGQKSINSIRLMNKGSDRFFKKVIKGMLPKNKLGAKMLTHLYVYNDKNHHHQSQNPKMIDIDLFK